jgi:hypothetical protein
MLQHWSRASKGSNKVAVPAISAVACVGYCPIHRTTWLVSTAVVLVVSLAVVQCVASCNGSEECLQAFEPFSLALSWCGTCQLPGKSAGWEACLRTLLPSTRCSDMGSSASSTMRRT